VEARTVEREVTKKYLHLYEFAPAGYFTISGSGRISDMNLTGTRLFGKDRAHLQNSLFNSHLSTGTMSVFNTFLKKVLNSRKQESCDVTLLSDGNTPVYLHLTGNVAENGEECLVTAVDITGLKLGELALRANEEKLQAQTTLLEAQLNSTIDGILMVDQDNNRILINRRMIELFKVPADIIEDKNDSKLLKHVTNLTRNPDKFLERIKYLNDHPGEESSDEIEFANGMVIDRYSAPVVSREGKSYGRIWIFRDITERKLAEEAVREKDIQFEKLSSQVPDLIYQFTRKPDGTFCVPIASPGIKNVFGCSPVDVRDDFGPIARVIFPEDSARVISEIEYSAQHLTYFTCEFRVQIPGRDIQWIFSRSVPERLKDGSITWYGFSTDITMIKKTQEILRESEERFRSVAESAYDAIITIDIKGRISGWNKSAEKMFGYTSAEATGRELSFIIPPHFIEAHRIGLERMEHGGTRHVVGNVVELAGLRKDGTEFPIELSLSEWETGSGKFFTGIIRDITERKRTDQELIKAKEKAEESDLLKSAFLANMSHEIRTPMNGILGFAGLLKEPDLSGEEQQQYIRIIEKSGARMLNIINDIIDISKIEAGQMSLDMNESNINDHIEDIYTFFKPEVEAKGILLTYKCSLPAKEAKIITDHHKFDAILINLVKNAIKYTHSGSIEFGYTIVGTHHDVSVGTHHGVSLLQFYVKDTGIGIPGDRQEAIFERFIQADISDKQALQGAGLGLAISKAYVEMLGGKIRVESEQGKGSVFYFTLPFNTAKHVQSNIQDIAMQVDLSLQNKNLKILIAEDDETSDFLITTMLKNSSSELMHVNSGDQAVDTCQRHSDLDLVLMDIKMPGIDGYEATRQIRRFNKEVIIIAQTAYGLAGDREKALESGCNDYISKPINKEELLLLLQKYFNQGSVA
jgi:PAS domain S-box-containing protein